MIKSIFHAIAQTPTWVWCLFVYLIVIALKALKPQTLTLYRLMVMPIVFTCLSIYMVVASQYLYCSSMVALSVFATFGFFTGVALVQRQGVSFNRKKMLVHTPGSAVMLGLVLMIFAVKYYFGYTQTVDPVFAKTALFQALQFSVSAFCTGIALGRLGTYCYGLFLK